MSIISQIESFSKLHILVIGDAMVDAYFMGSVDRISPEAPVPIIAVSHKDHRPGGSANVALNVKSLGAKASLCSIVGKDTEGMELVNLLSKEGIDVKGMITDTSRPTTVKTRVIAANHHLIRIDHEVTLAISTEIEDKIINFLKGLIDEVDAVILEDYNKGMLTERVITAIIDIANVHLKPTIVDPKNENFFAFKNCTLFKPNRKEIKEGLKTDKDLSLTNNVSQAADELIKQLGCVNVMVTLSEDGVFVKSNFESKHIKAHPRKIIDVSGAGDTVVSVAALCLASGMNISSMAEVSNIAGGLVCEKVGVVPIDLKELRLEIERLGL